MTLKRFYTSDNQEKKQKIWNRLKLCLKAHRYIYWMICKKLNRKEIKTKISETYYLPLRDNSISKHLFIDGHFDLDKLVKVSKLVNIKNKTLVDIGANLGSICIPACKRNLVKSSIAIEPDKETFKYLERNIKINGVLNITSINSTVGSIEDYVDFGSKPHNPGDSKIINDKNSSEFNDIYRIRQITINSLVGELNPQKTILWIDVQGFEPLVLKGASIFTEAKTPLVIEVFPFAINQYSKYSDLERELSNYSKFANLRFDIKKPFFEPIENFKYTYANLERIGGYSDFLFI